MTEHERDHALPLTQLGEELRRDAQALTARIAAAESRVRTSAAAWREETGITHPLPPQISYAWGTATDNHGHAVALMSSVFTLMDALATLEVYETVRREQGRTAADDLLAEDLRRAERERDA